MALKDVKSRIASVKNIQKITRAMEMIAAARLRKAEQRVQELRDYASAVRRMTRQAADAAGNVPSVPLLAERDREDRVGIVLFTGDRGLAGGFNSQIIRAGTRLASEIEGEGRSVVFFASGRRGISSLRFRGYDPEGAFEGYTDRPAYADARAMASAIMAAYVDGKVDRVEVFYNRYVSPVSQVVTRETLLPLKQASIMESDGEDGDAAEASQDGGGKRALVEYEPGPEEILERLVPAYVEISIFRSMLESTASEHGARMTAMRNASENASDIIADLTLQMNRERQAEITQEIMEVVAGAESLV
jgi:F-type H+-transporting ATPase subunit gamma